jgi:ketosteroid isomerase-like protein
MSPREDQLRTIYAAFNARDIDAVLAALSPDVDWPNGWEGGHVHGHAAVRDYWTRQWAAIDPSVEPLSLTDRDDDHVAVTVAQTIRAHDGDVIDESTVLHVYAFDGDLVRAMEIEEPAG